MPSLILTDTVASLAELELNHYEYIMELVEDAELAKTVEERQHEVGIPVDLESLRRPFAGIRFTPAARMGRRGAENA